MHDVHACVGSLGLASDHGLSDLSHPVLIGSRSSEAYQMEPPGLGTGEVTGKVCYGSALITRGGSCIGCLPLVVSAHHSD